MQPDCLKVRVVCEIVYRDMHIKDLLGSIDRVGYCIPVPDFYLVILSNTVIRHEFRLCQIDFNMTSQTINTGQNRC